MAPTGASPLRALSVGACAIRCGACASCVRASGAAYTEPAAARAASTWSAKAFLMVPPLSCSKGTRPRGVKSPTGCTRRLCGIHLPGLWGGGAVSPMHAVDAQGLHLALELEIAQELGM